MLITLVSFAFVLGVLVFVHELGHFLAAKRVGIRVLKFQLGFNPTIISFRRGDTEYAIGALPLGGYVKMAGENPEEERTGRADEFASKTKWQRFQVLIMGPTMNLLLAVVLSAIVLYHDDQVPVFQDQPPVVGVVVDDSPAAKVGIQPGDLITSVAGRAVGNWEDLYLEIGSRANKEVSIGVRRNGVELTRTVTTIPPPGPVIHPEVGYIGVEPNVHPHIPSVVPGDPADHAGFKAGDIVLAADGKPIAFSNELRDAIAKHAGQPIALTILRDGQPQTMRVTPVERDGKGWIGISILDETKNVKPTVLGALKKSVTKNVELAGMILQTIGGLITRETSPKQLMGPITIAQLSGEYAQAGVIPLLILMATLSLNLGLLNLMPIPVLDGGHIFILALEGLARRDFSLRVKEKMLLAGFFVLMTLMVTVIYNDLARISWIGRLLPWK